MENTPKNKAKFFALYWGQDLLHGRHIINGNLIDLIASKNDKGKYWLELKHLSLMTDADVLSMADLPDNEIIINDFVRSRGYAVLWMRLSIEKLIEYGWVKLKGESC